MLNPTILQSAATFFDCRTNGNLQTLRVDIDITISARSLMASG